MLRLIKVAAAMLLFFSASEATLARGDNQSQASGDEAALTLKALSGQQQSLSDFRGKIVVLNFWATWCVPCREEMPALASIQKLYGARGVRVIGASADEESTQKSIPQFARRMKIDFPIWVGATTADMQRLGLGDALPATAIIDRDGVIVGRILGVIDKADLQNRIEWLMGDRTTPAPAPFVNNIETRERDDEREHKHEHKDEEEHEHGGVGIEGASTVPS